MARILLLALLLTLSAASLILQTRADDSTEVLLPHAPKPVETPGTDKSIAEPPEKADEHDDEGETAAAEGPMGSRRMGRHHSPEDSVAGGGVIIGGLVTAMFAAVYCYIRVTRRRPADENLA